MVLDTIMRVSSLRTSDFKNNILKMIVNSEFYGYEIHKMLAEGGSDIELSRLYRILNEMSKEGLLEGRWAKSQLGPKRRLYTISANGRNELNGLLLDAISTVHSFYGRYLASLAPKFNMIESIISIFNTCFIKESFSINFFYTKPSFDAKLAAEFSSENLT